MSMHAAKPWPLVADLLKAQPTARAALADLAIPHDASPYGQVTISCGCVTFQSRHDLTPTMLLKGCDEALYEAKEKGRNCSVVRVQGT